MWRVFLVTRNLALKWKFTLHFEIIFGNREIRISADKNENCVRIIHAQTWDKNSIRGLCWIWKSKETSIKRIIYKENISRHGGKSRSLPRGNIWQTRGELSTRLNHDPCWKLDGIRLLGCFRWSGERREKRRARLNFPFNRGKSSGESSSRYFAEDNAVHVLGRPKTEGIDPWAFIGNGRGADKIIWRCLAANNGRTEWKERERAKGMGVQWDDPHCVSILSQGSRDTRLIFASE